MGAPVIPLGVHLDLLAGWNTVDDRGRRLWEDFLEAEEHDAQRPGTACPAQPLAPQQACDAGEPPGGGEGGCVAQRGAQAAGA